MILPDFFTSSQLGGCSTPTRHTHIPARYVPVTCDAHLFVDVMLKIIGIHAVYRTTRFLLNVPVTIKHDEV